MSLAPGTSLNHYTITASIGVGGMGEVYRARDEKLARAVAIKVLPAARASEPERLARFKREAQVLASLNHSNIAQVYGLEAAGLSDGSTVHFLAMELVEGEDLAERLKRGAIPPDEAIAIAKQIVEGLEDAHEHDVIHRDLKPANAKLAPDGKVKILDFGLAKVLEDEGGASELDSQLSRSPTMPHPATETGMILGTAAYMSPEQARGKTVDKRTDIWSFGVLLFEMLAGAHLFAGDTATDTLAAVLKDEIPWVRLPADTPRGVVQLLNRCLTRDLRERLRDIGEARWMLAEQDDPQSGAGDRQPGAGAAVLTGTPADERSGLVVLPFVNRSADPANEYFSDGLTEEVIADLAQLGAFRVISRNSAMLLKGTGKGTLTIAEELGVSHIVTGSVRRSGDALRVTAELVEASTDSCIWSDKYSGMTADVFAIQEDIARRIASALQDRLGGSAAPGIADRPIERPIEDVVAYDCYLRARQELYAWLPGSLERAERLVDQALDVVGRNPLLLAMKGQIKWAYVNVLIHPDERYLDEAGALAAQALAIDPDHYLGVFVRGLVAGLHGETESALRDLRQAGALRTGDANLMLELSRFSQAAGLRDLEPLVQEQLRVDPLTPVAWFGPAYFHLFNGRLAESVPYYRKAIELAGARSPLNIHAAWSLATAGLRGEAEAELRRTAAELKGSLSESYALFLLHALAGDAEQALVHATPELTRAAGFVEWFALGMADAYALLGLADETLEWTHTAIRRGFINHPYLARHDPFLASVRHDPRFQSLMEEVRPRWEAIVAWEKSQESPFRSR